MGFIRVRAATGPAHEFDVSEVAYAADPDAYKVVNKKPVSVSRPVKYIIPAVKAAGGKKE